MTTCSNCSNTCPDAPDITINETTLQVADSPTRFYNQPLTVVADTAALVWLLPAAPISVRSPVISVGGVVQRYDTDYTISGQYVRFVTAPDEGEAASVNAVFVGSSAGVSSDGVITGARMIWSDTVTVPAGYLEADGSSLLIADYPGLYAVLGTLHGTGDDPGNTFNLPNDPAPAAGLIWIIKT